MKNFAHVNATSVVNAVDLLKTPQSKFIAGGTDLLTLMKPEIITPDRLVNLKTIPEMEYIHFEESVGLQLGALATLTEIWENDAIRQRYPLLFQAISVSASPQLRNRGTIGGNLNQASRCWYYRGQFKCWLKGGEMCYAREGQNAHHAIFGGGPCYTVHPSDPAPALIALEAVVHIISPQGESTLPLEQLFHRPLPDSRRLTILEPSQIITELTVPPPSPGSRGIYLKAMERQVWSFAQASLALQVALERKIIKEIRLVLGGVASTPWRLSGVEDLLRGQIINDTIVTQATELAVSGAVPLSYNGYKIPLVKGLLKEALMKLRE